MKDSWRPKPSKPYKARDPAVTSAMMSAVRGRENKAEVSLRKALWRMGFRYRKYPRGIYGKPDFVFPAARVAVFVDGDFWHGRGIIEDGVESFRESMRTAKREWWIQKISHTIKRDTKVTATLEEEGWEVVRIWESYVLKDLDGAVSDVTRKLGVEASSCRE